MKQRQFTRRIVLSTAVVALAVLTALGGPDGVDAKGQESWNRGSKEAFQKQCESNMADGKPGTFLDSPKDNLTACFYGDGSKTVCDQQGNNCYDYPPPKHVVTGDGPFAGSTGEIIEIFPTEPMPAVEETVIGGGVVVEDMQIHANETPAVAPAAQPLFAEAGAALAAPVETPLLAAAEPAGVAPVETPDASAAEPSAPAALDEVVEPPAEVVDTPAEEPIPAAATDAADVPVEEPVAEVMSDVADIPAEEPDPVAASEVVEPLAEEVISATGEEQP